MRKNVLFVIVTLILFIVPVHCFAQTDKTIEFDERNKQKRVENGELSYDEYNNLDHIMTWHNYHGINFFTETGEKITMRLLEDKFALKGDVNDIIVIIERDGVSYGYDGLIEINGLVHIKIKFKDKVNWAYYGLLDEEGLIAILQGKIGVYKMSQIFDCLSGMSIKSYDIEDVRVYFFNTTINTTN